MAMNMSLNKAIKRFRSIATNHKQINTFYFGDIAGVTDNDDVEYPVMIVDYAGGVIDGFGKVTNYNFTIALLDLVNQANDADGNEFDVISDMLQVGEDIVGQMKSHDWAGLMYNEGATNVQVLKSQTGDNTAGVALSLVVQSGYDSNRCDNILPSPIVPEEFQETVSRTKLVLHTVTAEANTITVADIVGKIVVGVFREGQFKSPKATAVTNTNQVYVHGTQTSEDDAVTSSDGIIELTTNDVFYEGEIISVQYIG